MEILKIWRRKLNGEQKAILGDFHIKRELNLNNFKECVVSQIGETLYWEFFAEYSRKWWGIDPENLSSYIAPKNLKIGEEKSYVHIGTNFERPIEEIYPIRGEMFETVKKLESEIVQLGVQS